ncbi:unnamed protein product [Clonostachys rosea]|uniref:DUF6604 domain-containing protein n=1 Tax=Bionectria ochroleuca TaxID=29856 RepID=A0ABY6UC57_BIOOC|nr:unnamed protein product [Clonostachys rosea]
MSANPIRGIYQQYKEDIDSVTAWLASTAVSNNYRPELLHSNEDSATPKPKGQQNNEAKKEGKPSAPEAQQGKKYLIALRDFVKLATFIKTLPEPVVVPTSFEPTDHRLIALRSKIHAFAGKNIPAGVEMVGNFVEVLKEVLHILCPAKESTFSAAFKHLSLSELSGSSSELSLDDIYQEFMDSFEKPSAGTSRLQHSHADTRRYEYQPETCGEYAIFVYLTLAQDLNQIRSIIKDLWSESSDSRGCDLDPASVAVASHAAMSFGMRMIDEAKRALLGLSDISCHHSLATLTFYTIRKSLSLDADGEYEWGSKLLYFAFEEYQNGEHPPTLQMRVNAEQGNTFNPKLFEEATNGNKRRHADVYFLIQAYCDSTLLGRPGEEKLMFPVEDYFLRGSREWSETKHVSLSFAFASHVLLDIHHVLGCERADELFATCKKELDGMWDDANSYLRFTRDVGVRSAEQPLSDQVAESIKDVWKTLTVVCDDHCFAHKSQVKKDNYLPPPSDNLRNSLFRSSPMLAGLFLYESRKSMHVMGIVRLTMTGSTTSLAYLYNILQRDLSMEPCWKDMSLLIDTVGEDRFWPNGQTGSLVADLIYLLTQCHTSQENYNAETWKRGLTAFEKHGWPLVATRAFTQVPPLGFRASPFGPEAPPAEETSASYWTADRIEGIIQHATPQVREMAVAYMSRCYATTATTRAGHATGAQDSIQDIRRLVHKLCFVLHSERAEMAFPYLYFHIVCWKLLTKLKPACRPTMERRMGADEWRWKSGATVAQCVLLIYANPQDEEEREALGICAETLKLWAASDEGSECAALVEKRGVGAKAAASHGASTSGAGEGEKGEDR